MMFEQWGRVPKRQMMLQALSLVSSLTSMFMLYKGIGVVCNTESPVVVVLSGSMEPAFKRGDVLFLTNPPHTPYRTGDIVVYRVPGAEIPIVHRIVQVQDTHADTAPFLNNNSTPPFLESSSIPRRRDTKNSMHDHDQLLLTKGDNNAVDDIALYNGLEHLQRKHVVGKVKGFLPYVGYASIIMNEMPRVKYAFFAAIGLSAL